MDDSEKALVERLHVVRDRIAHAARSAGRDPQEARLVAVSKLQPARAIAALATAGQCDFGESYVQEACAKQAELSHLALRWHCIGHVQTNKAKNAAGRFQYIHSLDSLKLAQALRRHIPISRRQQALIQVNVGDESQKTGVRAEELPVLAEHIARMPEFELAGLMCLPPFFDNGARARPYFALLRELCERLRIRLGLALPELSMGMSGDFAEAVAEGATLVRIGTDVFGPRPSRRP
ncbi:MAG: YggS family pyridoxal phosphate-dependent enzyme [Deltaproteobacteria bacterium]|jgi:pyridoxal phosphate enzyme (YggS family)|nr:YggS family pyridoxal phosphate-dependent enzyme [Deltaproteobacteria bacterium]